MRRGTSRSSIAPLRSNGVMLIACTPTITLTLAGTGALRPATIARRSWISRSVPPKKRSAPSAARGSRRTSRVPRSPSGDTRAGLRRAPRVGTQAVRRPLRGGVVAGRSSVGRDASLWEWLIFEEEYYRAGAPQRVTQNGIFLLAPTIFEFGTPEQQARILPKMASGEQTWCQGWSEPNAGSDLAGIQSKAVRDDAAGGWRLVGPEDLDHARRVLHPPLRPLPQRPRRRAPSRTHLLPRRSRHPRRDGARRRAPRRRRRFRRGVPRRRLRRRRRRARRTEPGLGRRDGHHRFRARPHAALARPLPRDRATPDRPVPRPRRRSRSCATGSSPRTSTPRRTAGRRSGPSPAWSKA